MSKQLCVKLGKGLAGLAFSVHKFTCDDSPLSLCVAFALLKDGICFLFWQKNRSSIKGVVVVVDKLTH